MLAVLRDLGWPLSLILLGAWAIQVYRLRLVSRYPALFSYLTGALLTSCGGFAVHQMVAAKMLGHSFYFWYWAITQPLLGLLLFAVFFECFYRMAADYQAVRRLARMVVCALASGLAVALGLFLATHSFETPEARFWTGILLIQQQSVYFATGATVLLLIGIRRFFALPVPGNVGVTMGALGLYSVGIAAMTAIRSYVGHTSHTFETAVDVFGLGMYCACLLFGAAAFSQKGEAVVRDRRLDMPAREALDMAAGRLQDVNEQLLKVVAR